MKRTKVFSYLEVKQRMRDMIGTGSETERGMRCLDGECLLRTIFSARRFITVFFAKNYSYGSFLNGFDFSDSSREMPGCQTGQANLRNGQTKEVKILKEWDGGC